MSRYVRRPNLVLGFHGSDQKIRDRVIAGREELVHSANDWDWLGHGIYFWENNYERALAFAQEQKKRGVPITTPSVVGATFDLGDCLDLTESGSLDLVCAGYEFLRDTLRKQGKSLPKNIGGKDRLRRVLDCAVIEAVHQLRLAAGKPPYDSVRSVFVEGKPLYRGAGFRSKTHIQICIRNPECIKGYFLPKVDGITPLRSRRS